MQITRNHYESLGQLPINAKVTQFKQYPQLEYN